MRLPRKDDAVLYGWAAVTAYFFLGATAGLALIVGVCCVLIIMWGGRE